MATPDTIPTPPILSENEALRGINADYDTRYGRALEHVEVVQKLWRSYEDDALVRNRETGQFLDDPRYFPPPGVAGGLAFQVVPSGPNHSTRALRDLGFEDLVVPWPAGGEERVEEFAHRAMPRLLGRTAVA